MQAIYVALLVVTAAPAIWAQATAKPDFNGVWLLNRRNVSSYPDSQWTREKLPFTAKGLEMLKANKPGAGPRSAPPEVENDPMRGANPTGLLRTLQYSRHFEFIQLPGKLVQMYGWGKVWRTVAMDGRPVPEDIPAGPYWYGYSVGKWEGDTLVITTIALDERAWIDAWGTPISLEARVEERWKRVAPDKLQMTITVTDPITYSKPWTSGVLTYTKQPDVTPEEVILAPMDEQRFYENMRKPALTPAK